MGKVVRQPVIFEDELFYWQMARSFFEHGRFLFFGSPFDIPSRLYPAALSITNIIANSEARFEAAKILNAVLMSSACFPAYGLAREFLGHRKAVGVAVLSVLVPGMAYTATIQAENLYYPLFILAFWLAFRTLAGAGWGSVLPAGLTFVAAYYTKPHLLVLATAYCLIACWQILSRSPLSDEVEVRQGRSLVARTLRLATPPGLLIAGFGLRFTGSNMQGASPLRLVVGGIYADSLIGADRPFSWPHFGASVAAILAAFVLGVAVLPLGLALCQILAGSKLEARHRLLVHLTVLCLAIYLVVVARHNTLWEPVRAYERYVFVLSPMLLLLGLLGLDRSPPWQRWLAAILAPLLFLVPVLMMGQKIVSWYSPSDAPSLAGLFWLKHLGGPYGLVAVVFGVGLSLAGLLLSRRLNGTCSLMVLWGLLLLVLNIGWYGVERSLIQPGVAPFTQMARDIHTSLQARGPVGFLSDNLDWRVIWYSAFWWDVDTPIYSLQKDPPWRGRSVKRSANGTPQFGTPAPHFLVASSSISLPYPVAMEFPLLKVRVYRNLDYNSH